MASYPADGVSGAGSARTTLRRLARGPHGWAGKGTVRVAPDALELDAGDPERVAREDVVASVRSGRTLWLRRRGAADLLIACRKEGDAKRLHAALSPPPPPDGDPVATNAIWRRVLREEAAEARRGWFGERSPVRALRELGPGPWEGRGDIVLTPESLRFVAVGAPARRTARQTIRDAVLDGRLVWIRRTNAPDWLVRCRTTGEAAQLVRSLRLER